MATAATSAAAVRPSAASGVCPDCRLTPPDLVHDFATGDLLCAHCNASVAHRLTTQSAKWSPPAAESLASSTSSGASEPPSPILAQAQRSRSRAVVQRQERNLQRALGEITQYSKYLDLPASTLPLALSLYQRAEAANLHRGKNPTALAAACLFLACRQQSIPRTFKEICHHTRVPRKDIGRTFKVLKDRLLMNASQQQSPMQMHQQQPVPLARCMSVVSDDLIARFCQRLSLLGGAMECAKRVNLEVRSRDTLAGKSPVSVAAACIYLAAHLVAQPRLPNHVSCVAGVSEVTIRNAYRLLYADRHSLVGPCVLETDPLADIDNLPAP
ncbi:transcription initiation factor IIB [Coemansia erecta]|uniref:Transcription initiation factor IIB n=1 Tax=Coemansia erecta TaxID=147472 RepID=A0A9W7Y046_9FUNG|nr:transcription initiation factor IIB [Coemansia erecta]